MKIVKNLEVPTGNILIVEGERGKLELVSLGDYGKDVNLKCDFMGLTREIQEVKHTDLLPLSEKWVITISTQYGCSMNCSFCDVPKVGPGKNATYKDLINQVKIGISLHPEIEKTKRLNVHFARMGEPTWNKNVLLATVGLAEYLKDKGWGFHPVVSTMMPHKNNNLEEFLRQWMYIKNEILNGEAGLQLSINSTSETERTLMFNNNQSSFSRIGQIVDKLPNPIGRKITLNFAVANYEINPEILLKYFNPEYFLIKLTPMHKTETALQNGIKTEGDYTSYYPYKEYEESLKNAGYDVLVFIASKEEDEGLITCGNAILSGSRPKINYKDIL